jgi:AcrR family transcriptional regulator
MVQRDVKPRPHPRQRLLSDAMAHVAAHGIGNLSLRELAAAIGTSHRMLIYHFGSKEGLMVAIVDEVEAQGRQFFSSFIANLTVPPAEAAQAFWRRVSDPSLEQNVRLFFEVYGLALQGRPGTTGFLDRVVDAWLEPLTDYGVRRGVSPEAARVEARLGVAVTRGLLLDLVATGDRAELNAAFQLYVRAYEAMLRQSQDERRPFDVSAPDA